MQAEFTKCSELSDDKVALATQTYEMVRDSCSVYAEWEGSAHRSTTPD
jgi:hypothetical protein